MRKNKKKMLRKTEIALFLLPAIMFLGLVYAYPVLNLVRLSTVKGSFALIDKYVGLENYRYIFTSEFRRMLERTVIWIVGTIPACMLLGLISALVFNQKFPGNKILRSLFFIPWLIPQSILAIIWKWTFHPWFGLVNNILISLGIINRGIDFLSMDLAMLSIMLMRIWRGTPFAFLCLLAALQTVPKDIEEAADLDGASAFQKLVHIKLPVIKDVFIITTILLTTWTFICFDMVYVLTGGGPIDITEIFAVSIFKTAFLEQSIGIASVVSIMGVIILILLSYLYLKVVRISSEVN